MNTWFQCTSKYFNENCNGKNLEFFATFMFFVHMWHFQRHLKRHYTAKDTKHKISANDYPCLVWKLNNLLLEILFVISWTESLGLAKWIIVLKLFQHAYLNVIVPSDIKEIRGTEGIREGDRARLTCEVVGVPKPEVYWTRNDTRGATNRKITVWDSRSRRLKKGNKFKVTH